MLDPTEPWDVVLADRGYEVCIDGEGKPRFVGEGSFGTAVLVQLNATGSAPQPIPYRTRDSHNT
eukprot:gene7316-6885_t